eukprot:14048075-Alexandrium_andersonii.AAC.1
MRGLQHHAERQPADGPSEVGLRGEAEAWREDHPGLCGAGQVGAQPGRERGVRAVPDGRVLRLQAAPPVEATA